MRFKHEATAIGVDQRMALASVDLLSSIVTAWPASLGGLDALAVDDRGRGAVRDLPSRARGLSVPKRRSSRQPFTHRPEMQFGDPPIGRRRGSGSDRRFSAHPDSLANIRLLSVAMPECCVGKPEKPVLPCSRHACDEAIAVGRETIATPRHMLIRPDQHEPSTVTVAQTGVCQGQRLKRRFVFSRGFNEFVLLRSGRPL